MGYCDANVARQPNQVIWVLGEHFARRRLAESPGLSFIRPLAFFFFLFFFFFAQTPGGYWTLEEPSLCSRESLYREGSEHQALLVAPAPDPCIALSDRTDKCVTLFDWLKTDHNTAWRPEQMDQWEESNTFFVYWRFTLGESVDSGVFLVCFFLDKHLRKSVCVKTTQISLKLHSNRWWSGWSYYICRLVNLLGGSCANLFWSKNWVGITVRSSLSK